MKKYFNRLLAAFTSLFVLSLVGCKPAESTVTKKTELPMSVELPDKIVLLVTYSEPGMKGLNNHIAEPLLMLYLPHISNRGSF